MELFLEILVIVSIILGFILLASDDVRKVVTHLISVFLFLCVLIFLGFFFGMGTHLTNVIFGW